MTGGAEIVSAREGLQNLKIVLRLAPGDEVETVRYRGDTVCLSTQVGCAVGCPFCASGSQGFFRNLSEEELWAQVAAASPVDEPPIERITLSGIGEPLHNFAVVQRFLDTARRRRLAVSVTTSGGPVGRLAELLRSAHNGVTVSVHAGTEAVRRRMVPRGPELEALFATLAEVVPTLSRKRRKKTALAYLVLAGTNDADDEIDAFVARARPLGVAVHLYGLNPVEHAPFARGDRERFDAIYARMRAVGLVVRMSSTARLESVGGCGTLVAGRRTLPVLPASVSPSGG